MLGLVLNLLAALLDFDGLMGLIRSFGVGSRWFVSPSYREELRRSKDHKDLAGLDACAGMLAIAFVTVFSVGIFFAARHFVG